ncbi:MAG: HD domain-containing protein [Lachnospiraceae bacterium]|nr:HD domain-containing protein [Lachnospiraceae bacterium]
MKIPTTKSTTYRKYGLVGIVLCVLVNIFLIYISNAAGLPLYMDSVGAIVMTFLGGTLPGLAVAILTNLICAFFYSDAVFFSLVGAANVLCIGFFVENERYKKKSNLIWMLLNISVIGASINLFVQMVLYGELSETVASTTAKAMSGNNMAAFYVLALILTIGLNALDKILAIAISFAIYAAIPQKLKDGLFNSKWRQKPLSFDEIKKINFADKQKVHTLKFRITILLFGAMFVLIVIKGWISARTNYEFSRDNAKSTAENVCNIAREVVDADKIEGYMEDRAMISTYSNLDYTKTDSMLNGIKDSIDGVENIYIYQMRQDAAYLVFHTDERVEKFSRVGEKIEYDDQLKRLASSFVRGEEVGVQESNNSYGYVFTFYKPLFDSNRHCVAYVGVDIPVHIFSNYVQRLLIKEILAFAGYFILILVYGFRVSEQFLVYPIESLAQNVAGFMENIDNQEELDNSVRKLEKLDIQTKNEVEWLYKSICEMAVATTDQMRSIRTLAKSNEKMQSGLIITMANMVENRDSDTGSHIQKTAEYVRIILEGLRRNGYYTEKITDLYMSNVIISAPLHDIGKINVSDAILNKPGRLTEEEYEIMKTHTTAGKEILENAISTVESENYLKEAKNMAAYHHERWDGKGYPEGLHGQVIPLSARVMAVADVFDALTSPRVYKPAYTLEKALEIIKEGSGTQFDPKCVEVFVDSIGEVKKVLKRYQDMQ